MTKETRIYNREKAVSSISSAGKTGQLYVKKEKKKKKTRTLPDTIHRNKIKMG